MMPAAGFQILIATYNEGKIREVQDALISLPVKFRGLQEFSNLVQVKETGMTYRENAVLKALSYAEQTGLWALSDDSGLEVDALGGKPGIYSARFGGENISDQDRIQKLLETISEHRNTGRGARFVCSIALAGWRRGQQPGSGKPRLLTVAEANCEGAITLEPRGTNGFGFDPVFVPKGYLETFAELPAEVKNTVSHRAKALAALSSYLGAWLQQP